MKKNTLRRLLIVFLLVIIAFCSWNIFKIYRDYNVATDEYKDLSDLYTSEKSKSDSSDSDKKSNQDKNSKSSQENGYPEFKKIDFDSLRSLNSDLIGWINIPGTVIDYPIAKSKDNNDYLHLTFQKQNSSSGTLFMDMNNSEDFTDYNTIIYGHNMKNGSMFSSLRDYRDESFYTEHPYVLIYTPTDSGVYNIVSCYSTVKTSDAYKMNFTNQDEYAKWLEKESSNSQYKVADYDVNKTTITLSTCNGRTGTEQRWIVHLQKIY